MRSLTGQRGILTSVLVAILLGPAPAVADIHAPAGLHETAGAPVASLEEAVRERLRARIEAAGIPARLTVGDTRLRAERTLPLFYERRGFGPAWLTDDGVRPLARELLEAVREADLEGLDPAEYHAGEIARLLDRAGGRERPDPGLAVDLELLLTDAFLLYSSHLLAGRVDAETLHPNWLPFRREEDLARVLQEAVESGEVRRALHDLRPPQPGYHRLREDLARYRERVREGGWPVFAEGPVLRPGQRDDRVPVLRERLAATGDLDEAGTDDLYDEELAEAVRDFQRRHGLDVDALVGPATRAALNVPAADRVRLIELNLERWRWLPQDLGERHVLVNAADFRAEVVERGDTVLSMRAVVGRPYRQTPVFSDRITYLVFSPFWHVPHSLAVRDQLPLQQRDPGHFRRIGMRVFQGWGADAREIDPATVDWGQLSARNFPYRLRQDPGPQNALGGVKFMFPNRFAVYLHDTPARDLFARTARDFSSGCIRVENADELAAYLLRDDPRWTPERIRTAMRQDREQTVVLPEAVPVHLLYWTAWSGTDGRTHFRRDIYERDRPLSQALARPAAPAAADPPARLPVGAPGVH